MYLLRLTLDVSSGPLQVQGTSAIEYMKPLHVKSYSSAEKSHHGLVQISQNFRFSKDTFGRV